MTTTERLSKVAQTLQQDEHLLELIEAYLEIYEAEPPSNSELTEDQKAELDRRLATLLKTPMKERIGRL
jgi:hypothetical protein